MKTKIFYLVLVLFFFTNDFSAQKGWQSIGVNITPSLTPNFLESPINLGASFGLFFDKTLTRRIGFSTGINYLSINYSDKSFPCLLCVGCCPQEINTTLSVLEIPLILTINTDFNEDAKFKTYLTGGYSYGRIITAKREDVFSDKVSTGVVELENKDKYLNIFNLGFEVRYSLKESYMFSLGTNFKYTYNYRIMNDDIYNFGLQFKVGKFL